MDNAEYNDVSGTATFNFKDTTEMRRLMSRFQEKFFNQYHHLNLISFLKCKIV